MKVGVPVLIFFGCLCFPTVEFSSKEEKSNPDFFFSHLNNSKHWKPVNYKRYRKSKVEKEVDASPSYVTPYQILLFRSYHLYHLFLWLILPLFHWKYNIILSTLITSVAIINIVIRYHYLYIYYHLLIIIYLLSSTYYYFFFPTLLYFFISIQVFLNNYFYIIHHK